MNLDELEAALHAALALGDDTTAARLAAEIDALPAPAPVPILAAALYYAQEGLHVFPLCGVNCPESKCIRRLKERGRGGPKAPHAGTRGCLDATTDEQTIRAWWDRWPDSNVGIATGHRVDVVDIDGAVGQKSRALNWSMFDTLTKLGTVTTPRPGGMHIYVPANPAVGNGAGILPNIDYRGAGGYVVAPPSVTDGGDYRWIRPLKLKLPTEADTNRQYNVNVNNPALGHLERAEHALDEMFPA